MATRTIETEDRIQSVAVRQGGGGTMPLLALRTFVPARATVDVDDEVYEIRLLSEFSAVRRQQVINTWGRAMEILDRVRADEEVSDEEERVVEDAYRRVIRAAIPDMPDPVIARLNVIQREQLVAYFFRMTGEQTDPTLEALPDPEPTGA